MNQNKEMFLYYNINKLFDNLVFENKNTGYKYKKNIYTLVLLIILEPHCQDFLLSYVFRLQLHTIFQSMFYKEQSMNQNVTKYCKRP